MDLFVQSPVEEKCICQLCTCGRHRCPRHPQNTTLSLPDINNSSLSRSRRSAVSSDETKNPTDDGLDNNRQFAEKKSRADYPEYSLSARSLSRRSVVNRPEDHLRPEGDLVLSSHAREQYREFPVDRVIPKRAASSLETTSEVFEPNVSTSNEAYGKFALQQRPKAFVSSDHLHMEGQFEASHKIKEDFPGLASEKPLLNKLKDNLMRSVERFSGKPVSRMDYSQHRIELKPLVKKMSDNLRLDGEMEMSEKNKHDGELTLGTRQMAKKHSDNLQVGQGEFVAMTVHKQDYHPSEMQEPPVMTKSSANSLVNGSETSANRSKRSAFAPRVTSSDNKVAKRHRNRKDLMESSFRLGNSTEMDFARVDRAMHANLSQAPGDGSQAGSQKDYADMNVNESRPKQNRPLTSIHLEGDLDLLSTSKRAYDNIVVAHRPNLRSQSRATDSSIDFHSPDDAFKVDSMYRSSFALPNLELCPAAILDNPQRSKFTFSRAFNNHKFYKAVLV